MRGSLFSMFVRSVHALLQTEVKLLLEDFRHGNAFQTDEETAVILHGITETNLFC